jgi:hypothetical protein
MQIHRIEACVKVVTTRWLVENMYLVDIWLVENIYDDEVAGRSILLGFPIYVKKRNAVKIQL